MARKPASMYRRLKGQAFTRRQYTGGVPNNRILRYFMGNRKKAEAGGFPVKVVLLADNPCQIQDKLALTMKGMRIIRINHPRVG